MSREAEIWKHIAELMADELDKQEFCPSYKCPHTQSDCLSCILGYYRAVAEQEILTKIKKEGKKNGEKVLLDEVQ